MLLTWEDRLAGNKFLFEKNFLAFCQPYYSSPSWSNQAHLSYYYFLQEYLWKLQIFYFILFFEGMETITLHKKSSEQPGDTTMKALFWNTIKIYFCEF